MPEVLDPPAPAAAAPAPPAAPAIQQIAQPPPNVPTAVIEPRHGDDNMADSLKAIRKIAGVKELENPKDEPKGPEGETKADAVADPKNPVEPPKPPKAKELREAYEQLKAKHAKLESEYEKAKTTKPDPSSDPERKAILEEHESLKKRFKEVDDELRFTAYERSSDYKDKYVKPLDDAWAKALKELREIEITDAASGETRAATVDDMLTLTNLPLGRARVLAKELFGEAADDVMAHRRVLRDLSEAKEQAKADARANGEKWEKERREKFEQQSGTIKKELTSVWTEQMKADSEKLTWLKPVEGDDEGNEALTKAKEKWLSAFVADPQDPNLSPEQRAEAVRRHAALVNRAIAYTPMARKIKALETALAEKDKALAEFQKSEPKQPELGAPDGANGEPSIGDRIRKYANR